MEMQEFNKFDSNLISFSNDEKTVAANKTGMGITVFGGESDDENMSDSNSVDSNLVH